MCTLARWPHALGCTCGLLSLGCRQLQVCQQNADQLFLLALAVPLVVALVAVAWISRQPQTKSTDTEQVFQDPETGNYFKGTIPPERDRKVHTFQVRTQRSGWAARSQTAQAAQALLLRRQAQHGKHASTCSRHMHRCSASNTEQAHHGHARASSSKCVCKLHA